MESKAIPPSPVEALGNEFRRAVFTLNDAERAFHALLHDHAQLKAQLQHGAYPGLEDRLNSVREALRSAEVRYKQAGDRVRALDRKMGEGQANWSLNLRVRS